MHHFVCLDKTFPEIRTICHKIDFKDGWPFSFSLKQILIKLDSSDLFCPNLTKRNSLDLRERNEMKPQDVSVTQCHHTLCVTFISFSFKLGRSLIKTVRFLLLVFKGIICMKCMCIVKTYFHTYCLDLSGKSGIESLVLRL